MTGLKPIIEFMSWSFCLVSADQIINNAPKMLYMSGGQFGCPIVFRGNNGAGGQLGSTHSWSVESMFSSVPGLKLAVPATPRDAKGLLKAGIQDPDPFFNLESERMLGMGARGDKDFSRYLHGGLWAPPENDDDFVIPLGQCEVIKEGTDCTVVSAGRPVHFALEAAEALEKEGLDIEVINVRTYRPLDIETIARSVSKTNYCVVADQSWPFASVGAEVASQVYERCFDDLDNSVKRVHNDDVPAPYNREMEHRASSGSAGLLRHPLKALLSCGSPSRAASVDQPLERAARDALRTRCPPDLLRGVLCESRVSQPKHPCDCCGHQTLAEPSGRTGQICPVCFWEDSRWLDDSGDGIGGPQQ